MSDFPPVGMISGEDSEKFDVTSDDPAIRSDTDGGYELTRPRYTRRPRRTYTTGFTNVTEADMNLVLDFWDAMFGGSNTFTYTVPTTGVEIVVRFAEKPKYKYVGHGDNFRWDIDSIKLKEA